MGLLTEDMNPTPSWGSSWTRAIVGAISIIVLLAAWIGSISESPISGDAWHTLRMGFNIADQGVISKTDPCGNKRSASSWLGNASCAEPGLASNAKAVPTNYREPLPPIVLAGWLKVLEASHGPISYSFLKEGPGLKLAKLSNVLWAVILCLSVFAALLALTQSYVLAVIGAVAIGYGLDVDTLLTEPAAAALLALSSFLCMMAVRSGGSYYYFLGGLSFGLLILTKAIFFHVALAVIACLAVLLTWRWLRALSIKAWVPRMSLFLVGIAIAIGPWMARNTYYFGTPQVAQRTGIALAMRANYNQMTWTEYKGSFYVWAPNDAIRKFVGSVFGFSESDLSEGGSLQRLTEVRSEFKDADENAEEHGSPEAAITYYFRARAERVKIAREFQRQGNPNFETAADTELEERAIRIILADPLKHVIVTIPFLWRAAYFVGPVLALFAFFAVRWRRLDLFTYVVPALGMVLLYALTSHNEPRYDAPARPLAIVCLIALTWYLVSWLLSGHVIFNRFKPGPAQR